MAGGVQGGVGGGVVAGAIRPRRRGPDRSGGHREAGGEATVAVVVFGEEGIRAGDRHCVSSHRDGRLAWCVAALEDGARRAVRVPRGGDGHGLAVGQPRVRCDTQSGRRRRWTRKGQDTDHSRSKNHGCRHGEPPISAETSHFVPPGTKPEP